jgi:hypothetical protein
MPIAQRRAARRPDAPQVGEFKPAEGIPLSLFAEEKAEEAQLFSCA